MHRRIPHTDLCFRPLVSILNISWSVKRIFFGAQRFIKYSLVYGHDCINLNSTQLTYIYVYLCCRASDYCQPKNMDKIEIVKKPTDSVIYRNYSQKYTSTMQARDIREKKIERMNTMPNLKLAHGEMIAMEKMSPGSPDIPRFRESFLNESPSSSKTALNQIKSTTSTFGTFHFGSHKPKDNSLGIEGLMGAVSTGYLDQLKGAAMLMVDLDKKNLSGSQKTLNKHAQPHYQQDLVFVENEMMQMTPLMRVDEEEEDKMSVLDITKSSPGCNSRKSLISSDSEDYEKKKSKQNKRDSTRQNNESHSD